MKELGERWTARWRSREREVCVCSIGLCVCVLVRKGPVHRVVAERGSVCEECEGVETEGGTLLTRDLEALKCEPQIKFDI